MIEVRIRFDYNARASHLCDVMLDDLDALMALIRGWGIAGGDTDTLVGQFVVEDGASFFELVVEEES